MMSNSILPSNIFGTDLSYLSKIVLIIPLVLHIICASGSLSFKHNREKPEVKGFGEHPRRAAKVRHPLKNPKDVVVLYHLLYLK